MLGMLIYVSLLAFFFFFQNYMILILKRDSRMLMLLVNCVGVQEFTICFGTLLALWLVGKEYCLACLRAFLSLTALVIFLVVVVFLFFFLAGRSKALTSAVF